VTWPEAPRDCPLCPRLVAFRHACRAEYPDWWNDPVPAFGDRQAWLGLVGLAPGKHGANRTGRPFTGDYAGDLLFATLAKFGLTSGTYDARPDDGFQLEGAIILNAVKCLPPQNKPTPEEVATCRRFFAAQLEALPTIRVLIALGRIAHDTVLKHFGLRAAVYPFAHAAAHELPNGLTLIDSYHCSRYNQNTGRLTAAMFEVVFVRASAFCPASRSVSGHR
jgi:uracil-DNA glycosylase